MKFIKSVLILSFVLLFASVGSFAQIGFHPDSTSKSNIDNFGNSSSLLKYKRLGVSMEMGVGVNGSKYGAGAYTYMSPFLSYSVSPKFRLDVGASYIQGFNNSGKNEFYFGKNPSCLSVFARGNYLVSDKLLVSGAVYKTFDLNQPQTSDLNSQKRSLNNYGIMVGAEYKITENLTIGAQLNFSDRNTNYNPLYPHDNYSGGLQQVINPYSPFSQNRYHAGFGGW
ncbi:MAG TPA: hypothetical protein PKW80_01375 [Bacteroidales bacterium]|mgnify:CR=1 FL=1|nr:hypothetical protein [Bacteroidales bacterium]